MTTSTEPTIYLRSELLRPGDVVVCRGSAPIVPLGIAYATGSPYSHAFVVVSAWRWFEADAHGVGYSDTLGHTGWLNGPGVHEHVVAIPECRYAVVLRHPALRSAEPASVEAAITTIVEQWSGQDYSDFRRLFPSLMVSGKARWWVRSALRAQQWLTPREKDGMFCSEVVARTYEALAPTFPNSELFSAPRKPELVHPGHLVASRLEAVERAVVDTARLEDGLAVERDGFEWDRRFSTKMARLRRVSQMEIDAARQAMRAEAAERRAKAEVRNARIEHVMRASIQRAKESQNDAGAAKLEAALQDFGQIASEINRHDDAHPEDVDGHFQLCINQSNVVIRMNELQAEIMEALPVSNDPRQWRARISAHRAAIAECRERVGQTIHEFRQWRKTATPT